MKKKRKKKKIGILRIIIFAMLLYIMVIMINQNKLMKELEGKKMVLQKEIHILEEEIDGLSTELENSDSLDFIEKVARDELGMVKPREIIVIDKGKIKNTVFNLFKSDTN